MKKPESKKSNKVFLKWALKLNLRIERRKITMSQLKLIITRGCPGSGKSTWAKSEIAKDPLSWLRLNNDDLRASFNGSVFSGEYEKLIRETRQFLIRNALKRDLNVIVDNVNASTRNWEEACKLAKESNKNVQVFEKLFYVELEEALERNAQRQGSARVPDEVIKKFWKELGGKQFRFSNAKVEVFTQQNHLTDRIVAPMEQEENLPRAVVFDNDGTISLIHADRSPYDASTCDQDMPHPHVIECMRLYFRAGYQILFVSGREEKDREPTERFYQKHFPEVTYQLYMRPTGDQRKDVIIKEEIFNNHIKDKYYIAGWFDDRLQIVQWLYGNGFPVFRVGDPEANF
jgi:predicted kinase